MRGKIWCFDMGSEAAGGRQDWERFWFLSLTGFEGLLVGVLWVEGVAGWRLILFF